MRRIDAIDENTMNIEIGEYNEYRQDVVPMLLNACSSPVVGSEAVLCPVLPSTDSRGGNPFAHQCYLVFCTIHMLKQG